MDGKTTTSRKAFLKRACLALAGAGGFLGVATGRAPRATDRPEAPASRGARRPVRRAAHSVAREMDL